MPGLNQKASGLLQQGTDSVIRDKAILLRQRVLGRIRGEEALDLNPPHVCTHCLLAGSEPHGSS